MRPPMPWLQEAQGGPFGSTSTGVVGDAGRDGSSGIGEEPREGEADSAGEELRAGDAVRDVTGATGIGAEAGGAGVGGGVAGA